MNKADCFYLGHISKLHGFKGEVSLFLDVTNPEDYKSIDAIFIDIDNSLTPFFVETIRIKNKGFATIKLKDVDDEFKARSLLRKEVYLSMKFLPKLEGVNFYDHEVIGFNVFDQREGYIGELKSVIDLKLNPLLQIVHNDKEILIPLIKGLVKKIDRINNELYIKAPEGLIDLYLQ
ncbi:MAG: 16S rRNA processing protein RimM [Crocinitomicaceae bacterium]|nr:16S rRNA processing protein RimM [Crocinitomicaceae bacterium]|tara:strand:+ start:73 stop:600 length:528 start_codon:yes stop_codon:yes gene_type:complete